MTNKPELLDIMEISWTCQDCEVEFDTESPVYSDINGEFINFSCPECSHDYEVRVSPEDYNGIGA
jgi:rubredoxin